MRTLYTITDSKIEDNQYRVGPNGLIKILGPIGQISNDKIHHSSSETGMIFGIIIILVKENEKFVVPSITDNFQYHTVASILEKWPKTLPNSWLQDIINS